MSQKSLSGSLIVDEISQLHINSIPEAWYKTIRKKTGPHSTAILILWDLLYWYKWTEIRSEATGLVVGYKKKFKADLLQRSYQSIADKFGIAKSQAADIIYFLEKLGVLKRHFRTVQYGDLRCGNVVFIELIPSRIKEISQFKPEDFCEDEEITCNDNDKNSIDTDEKIDTYGEISQDHTSKNLQTNTNNYTNNYTKGFKQTCASASESKNSKEVDEPPTPEAVYNEYHENKYDVSPERFWELNNDKKWKNGLFMHWREAYKKMTPFPDEAYNPKLKFREDKYKPYSGPFKQNE